jgi:hypothetical protein
MKRTASLRFPLLARSFTVAASANANVVHNDAAAMCLLSQAQQRAPARIKTYPALSRDAGQGAFFWGPLLPSST